MRRRMYYLLPGLGSARKAMDDLLLARIEERHIHFLAKRGTPMTGLHEASVLQKTDIVHGAQLGFIRGAVLGAGAGAAFVNLVQTGTNWQLLTLVGATILGSLFGTWVASMVGASVPNSRLRKFESRIQDGRILLMIDVPKHRVDDVKVLIGSNHYEAIHYGLEPTIPVFP